MIVRVIALLLLFATSAWSAGTAENVSFLLSQVRTAQGALVAGTVTFYEAGTSTPKSVYLDRDMNTLASNPYTLDANATAQLYAYGNYRVVIKDRAGTTKFDRDNLYFEGFEVTGVVYSITDFGAIPDDGLDDSAAVNDAISTIPAGSALRFPQGTWNFTSSIVNSQKPITLYGDNVSGTILSFSGCDGLVLTHDANNLKNVEVRDMSVVTVDNAAYRGIVFSATDAAAYKIPRVVIKNVNVSGVSLSSAQEWSVAIDLTNADNGVLSAVGIKGKEASSSSGFDTHTVGLKITDTTTMHTNALTVYKVETGIYLTGQSEGNIFSDSELVAVKYGVNMTGLVVPSNNHSFSNMHISATSKAVNIDATTTSTHTFAHMFSNMFILKRIEDGASGDANYRAFDLECDRSVFTGISTQSTANRDYLTNGDVSYYLRGAASNNIFSNVMTTNPGKAFEFGASSFENVVTGALVYNDTSYTMTTVTESTAGRNRISLLYDNGSPGSGDTFFAGNSFDFKTGGNTAFRITNGATSTDSFIDVFGGELATGHATIRANSTSSATDVGIRLFTRGSGRVQFGTKETRTDTSIDGCVRIKTSSGTEICLATIPVP